jgi:DNA-binding HxlR family transcriptional regulator
MTTRTAAQRRDEARAEFESFLAECPSREILQTIASKWTCLVLASLADGDMRYNALARRIAGISPRMLTQTLRTLERDGLIFREVTMAVPVEVRYSLTELGTGLLGVVLQLKTWAETHVEAVRAARSDYEK